MATLRGAASSGLGLLLLLCAGCATPYRRAELPLGEWAGQGMFVLEKWPVGQSGQAETREALEHRTYPTRLVIEPTGAPDQKTLRIEIVSQRGEFRALPDLGERTHLVLIVRRAATLAHGKIALYDVIQKGASTSADPPDLEENPAGETLLTSACMRGEIVVWIQYQEAWHDLLRFRSDRACKDGAYFNPDGEYIRWSEVLHPVR